MVDNHTYDVDPWLQTWPLECVISSTWPLGDPWMPPKKSLATQECIEISLYSALGTANHLIIQPRVLRPGSVLSIGSNFTIMIPWFSKLQWENHFTLHPQVLRPESVFTGTQKVDFFFFFFCRAVVSAFPNLLTALNLYTVLVNLPDTPRDCRKTRINFRKDCKSDMEPTRFVVVLFLPLLAVATWPSPVNNAHRLSLAATHNLKAEVIVKDLICSDNETRQIKQSNNHFKSFQRHWGLGKPMQRWNQVPRRISHQANL